MENGRAAESAVGDEHFLLKASGIGGGDDFVVAHRTARLDHRGQRVRAGVVERRILVAGEMLELGRESSALHAACGKTAAEAGLNLVIGVSGAASKIVDAARKAGVEAIYLEGPEEAGEWLRANLREGDAVLLKASRAVRLERAVEKLLADGEKPADGSVS